MSELWTGYPNIEDTTLHFEFVLDIKAEQFLMEIKLNAWHKPVRRGETGLGAGYQ